jgi:phospholipid/cholesterol/gamma-HCH transport system substrate-binding protein
LATRTQKVKVGAFLIASAAVIVGGLLYVAGYRQGEKLRYQIVFEKSVLGLYVGGIVQYLGVQVGVVDDIYVGDDGKAYVDILIDPKKITLREGVEASLEYYSFATATMCVALINNNPEANPLPQGALIPTGPSQLESFSSQAAELMQSFNNIADKINTGLEGMEQGQLKEIVDEIKPFIEDARGFISEARDTLATVKDDLHGAIEDVKPGIQKFNELAEAGTKLANTADETLKNLRAKVDPLDVGKVQDELLALSQRLQDTTKALENTAESLTYGTDNMQHGLMQTLQTLNETLEAVRDLATYLQDDPSALLRGKGAAKEQ